MQAVFPAVTPCRRSALEHTLSRVLGLDDLLIPSNLDALCDFVRHGLVSWTLIQGWAVLHCPGITHPWWSPATHQLTPQSPPCSAPLSFLFKKSAETPWPSEGLHRLVNLFLLWHWDKETCPDNISKAVWQWLVVSNLVQSLLWIAALAGFPQQHESAGLANTNQRNFCCVLCFRSISFFPTFTNK